jgi:PAS domain S-box-containing protein
MFGYTAKEAIGRSVRMIIPDDLQAEEDMVLAQIRSGGLVDHYETRRRRKDGSEILVSLTVSPIVDDNGRVIGASKIARDITEQSRLRAAAREQALVTERLSETGAMVAASLDRHMIVQRVIDAATSLTQAEFGAFVHKGVSSATDYTLSSHAVPPRDIVKRFLEQRWDTLVKQTFHGDTAIRLDDVPDAPGGRWVIRSYLAVPVKTAAGEVFGGLLFGSSAGAAFTEHHQRIVSTIAAWASLALENARLYLAAREADRLKDDFLAVL